MILYYAMGGGLGHVVRARAVTHTLGLERETVLVSSSPSVADPRATGPLGVRMVPAELDQDPEAWRSWLAQTLAELRPRAMFVDTFPTGILGELAGMNLPVAMPLHHVARLVRTEALPGLFRSNGPLFDTCQVVEELTREHHDWLVSRARVCTPLALIDPPVESPRDDAARLLAAEILSRHTPYWLVVHSGPSDEVGELLRFAAAMRAMEKARVDLVVLTRAPSAGAPPGTFFYDLYPAALLFPRARRIISAGGFNIMRQATPWREIHAVLPFARRYDDQYLRTARARGQFMPGSGAAVGREGTTERVTSRLSTQNGMA